MQGARHGLSGARHGLERRTCVRGAVLGLKSWFGTLQGRTYLCKKLDLDARVAVVRPAGGWARRFVCGCHLLLRCCRCPTVIV